MQIQSLLRHCILMGILSAMLGGAANVHAALRVWSGNATMNNTWTNAQNWAGNIAPVPADDLQFPFDGLHPNGTDNYPAGTTFNSIMFWHGGTGGSSTRYNLVGNSIALNAGVSAVNS